MDDYNQIGLEEIIGKQEKHSPKEEPKDILDVLLDKYNRDPIVLVDEKGRRIAFEQVAIIPHEKDGEKVLFAVLKPIDDIDGIGDDEAVVFYVGEDESGVAVLKVETDECIAIDVFNEYYKLLDIACDEKKTDCFPPHFLESLNKKRKGGKV